MEQVMQLIKEAIMLCGGILGLSVLGFLSAVFPFELNAVNVGAAVFIGIAFGYYLTFKDQ